MTYLPEPEDIAKMDDEDLIKELYEIVDGSPSRHQFVAGALIKRFREHRAAARSFGDSLKSAKADIKQTRQAWNTVGAVARCETLLPHHKAVVSDYISFGESRNLDPAERA